MIPRGLYGAAALLGEEPPPPAGRLNFVSIAAPRNGTNSHTVSPNGTGGTVVAGATFTPTLNNRLVCVVEGAVTSTTPSGWTLPAGGSAVNLTGLYVWHRLAATGANSLSTTHNGSNYPVAFTFLEYPAGTTFVGSASSVAIPSGSTGPTLSGLTGTNQVFYVGAAANAGTTPAVPVGAFNNGVELVDTFVHFSSTDGYLFGLAEDKDYVSASASATWTYSTLAFGPVAERLVFALKLPA